MSSKNSLKQIRSLTFALFISASLNLVLVAFIFYWALTDRPPTPYCEVASSIELKEKPIAANVTNAHLLRAFNALPYEQLLLKLNKKGFVEDGFSERDLALAVLASYYDLDIDKAFQSRSQPLQKRWIQMGEGKEPLQVYPGLSDQDFAHLIEYVNQEKWPFKTKGLFQFLKKEEYAQDSSLKQAFSLTKEFMAVQKLFTTFPVEQEKLVELFASGDWASFYALYERVKKPTEPANDVRQRYLLTQLQAGSKDAAEMFLKSDYDFALKRLSDQSVELMVKSLDRAEPLSIRYLSGIAASPRSDKIKAIAVEKYELLAEKKWEPLVSREQVTVKTLSIKPKPVTLQTKPVPVPVAKTPTKPRSDALYIVQEGDSLWKIAKRYKLSVDRLRAYNRLKTDALKPGAALKIPDQPPTASRVM